MLSVVGSYDVYSMFLTNFLSLLLYQQHEGGNEYFNFQQSLLSQSMVCMSLKRLLQCCHSL